MTGKIIYEPPVPTPCDRGACEGKPKPENYRDDTRWQCDECGAIWEKYSGAQYNEPYSAWRRVKNGITLD